MGSPQRPTGHGGTKGSPTREDYWNPRAQGGHRTQEDQGLDWQGPTKEPPRQKSLRSSEMGKRVNPDVRTDIIGVASDSWTSCWWWELGGVGGEGGGMGANSCIDFPLQGEKIGTLHTDPRSVYLYAVSIYTPYRDIFMHHIWHIYNLLLTLLLAATPQDPRSGGADNRYGEAEVVKFVAVPT